MQYKELGQSKIEASVIGLGTWAIGGWMWGGTEKEDSLEAVRASVDQGVNLIDTAPIYGFGLSEEWIGEAIKGIRDKVVLATKCGLIWDRAEGVFHFSSDEYSVNPRASRYQVYKHLAAFSIRTEVERSLRRLQTDYIDLYQTHWQDESTPVEETMSELLKLKQEGKIRAIGVSNATVEQIRQYQDVGPVDSDQELYNMLDRRHDQENLPYCQENNIAFLAYSPLARGLLSGKLTPERQFNAGDGRSMQERFSEENRREAQKMLSALMPLAEKHDITLAQLAAAWTFHQPGCTHVLCGARNSAQAEANAGAGRVRLTPEDLQEIEQTLADFHHLV